MLYNSLPPHHGPCIGGKVTRMPNTTNVAYTFLFGATYDFTCLDTLFKRHFYQAKPNNLFVLGLVIWLWGTLYR